MYWWSNHQHVWGDRSPRFLLDTNKDICYRVQPTATTLSLLKQLSSIYTNLPSSTPPHPLTTQKNLNGKTQMKTDIPSQQNCDKSGRVWWSTWSSAQRWWVREWRLTLNKSTDNNRKPTLTIRVILLNWLFPFAREPLLLSREPTW